MIGWKVVWFKKMDDLHILVVIESNGVFKAGIQILHGFGLHASPNQWPTQAEALAELPVFAGNYFFLKADTAKKAIAEALEAPDESKVGSVLTPRKALIIAPGGHS